jgi:enterochelin esterase-like enzyme
MITTKRSLIIFAALWTASFSTRLSAAEMAPQFISPEVLADRHITFRIHAPKAQAVRLGAGDIPGLGPGTSLTQSSNGVWEVTVGPVPPGAFRYNFDVDGVAVVDPRNPATSESNANTWSLVYVPGAEFMDLNAVPHGAVAEVSYYSRTLSRWRRLHVYTPPGYDAGKGRFPVFYLLHGASDSDASWSSVGRAGFILDNLLSAGKAKPMLVVMPAGHTSRFTPGPRSPGSPRPPDLFGKEFVDDILPFIESHYRVKADRKSRALAGLSMGGGQTLTIGVPHLDKFAYLGVFSSGFFGIVARGTNAPVSPSWEEQHLPELDNARLKRGLKEFWFATGKDDFLVATSRASVDMLKKHGFKVSYKETAGAHTWLVWRDYLNEFAPLLFR